MDSKHSAINVSRHPLNIGAHLLAVFLLKHRGRSSSRAFRDLYYKRRGQKQDNTCTFTQLPGLDINDACHATQIKYI